MRAPGQRDRSGASQAVHRSRATTQDWRTGRRSVRLAKLPKEAILYDVRADMRHRLILTVYHQQCVVIDAGVLLPLLKPVGT